MKENFSDRIDRAREALREAEHVLIGGGSGLSAAAGLTYSGERFTHNFADFIAEYGMTDMYSAGFYPFSTQEGKWGYWARHILINRYEPPALPLYVELHELTAGKDRFVLTTNVDAQFYKAGFDPDRIFAVQGDYGQFQCASACHDRLYDNEAVVRAMVEHTENCRIPCSLTPKCPVCGGKMEVHIRKDGYFIEDQAWHMASAAYRQFAERALSGKTVYLEVGVGFNTPTIIRFPFEQMTYRNPNAVLIRINQDAADPIAENAEKTISFRENAQEVLPLLR